MTIVASYDWESDTFTHNGDTAARTAWRAAVAAIAAKAHEKLPACNGRIDAAVKLVLLGDVELLPDGGARVASRTDATVQYHLANGRCDCQDYPRAPGNLCAHRLAYGIARRATELAPTPPEPLMLHPAPAVPLPEAPASVNVRLTIDGREVQLTLRDTDEWRLLARLEEVLQRFPLPARASPPVSTQCPDTAPQCPTHGAMKQSTKGKGWYCPHKNADGSGCKSK